MALGLGRSCRPNAVERGSSCSLRLPVVMVNETNRTSRCYAGGFWRTVGVARRTGRRCLPGSNKSTGVGPSVSIEIRQTRRAEISVHRRGRMLGALTVQTIHCQSWRNGNEHDRKQGADRGAHPMWNRDARHIMTCRYLSRDFGYFSCKRRVPIQASLFNVSLRIAFSAGVIDHIALLELVDCR